MADPDRSGSNTSVASRRQLLKSSAAAALGSLLPSPAGAAQTPAPVGARPPASAPAQPAVTAPLSEYIAGSATAAFPEDIRELGKRHILDTIASIVACRDLQAAVLARRYAA